MTSWPPARTILLCLPALALMSVFAAGLVLLFLSSLTVGQGWGADNYVEFFARPDLRRTLVRTLAMAAITTLLCTLIAYPVARAITRAGRRSGLLTVLVILPWMVSIVVRSYGWIVVLGNRGTFNSLMMWTGVTEGPIQLLFNQTGILIGLVHVFCPFSIISLLAVMDRADPDFEEAAASLGARPYESFARVTLPLIAPGLLTGASIVFLLSAGAVLTPFLLGGPRDPMLAVQVYQDVFQLFNFPRAATATMILMVIALLVILPVQGVERLLTRRLPEGDGQ